MKKLWMQMQSFCSKWDCRPGMAKQILQALDLLFASRPRFEGAIHMVLNCSDIAFAPLGPRWRLMRQICVSELFTPKRLEGFKQIRVEEIRGIATEVLDMGVCAVQLQPVLLTATNRISCRMALSSWITELSSMHQLDLLRLIDEVMHLLGVFNIGDFIPWLRWLDMQGYVKRMKAAGDSWKSILQEVMDKRRKTREENDSPPCNDLLDVLLDNSATHTNISDNNIQAILMVSLQSSENLREREREREFGLITQPVTILNTLDRNSKKGEESPFQN